METTEAVIKYAALAAYSAVLLVIGWAASRRIRGLKDYFIGGKTLGYWVAAFSARATGESSWLLLGLTGMGAAMGVKAFWIVAGEVLGVTLSWTLMARRFKRQSDRFDAVTIPDYLAGRFGTTTHRLRVLAAFVLCVFVTIYVSAQIDAIGKSFEEFFQWNYFAGVLVGFAIVVVYVFSGGFLAVAWSDLFQGIMMLLGLVLLPVVAWLALGDERGAVWAGLARLDPALLDPWGAGGFTLLNVMGVIGFMMIGIGFLGSPQIYVRFMAVRDEQEIVRGRPVAIVFTLLTDGAAVLIGLLGRYMLDGQDLGPSGEKVLPLLVDHVFPLLIVAIYIPIVLCAIMSTVDSLLVVASSALTRDFYQKIFRPDLREESMGRISRTVTLGLSIAALTIALSVAALSPTRTIFWFVIFGWSGIAASFCPVIILSLFWRGYTEKGAMASMIAGFLCVPLFKFAVPALAGDAGIYFVELSELPPSFAVALLVGVVVSLLDAKGAPVSSDPGR